ncbi:MAG TPA: hypothetical protein VGM76_09415 [Lacipirellulaceae bacterium]
MNLKLTWPRTLIIGLLVGLLTGCGSGGGPFSYVPVSGKVTYDDGSSIPVGGMKVYFHSLDPPSGEAHVPPGIASAGPNGAFENVTSHKYGDGLIKGKYKVTLVCEEAGKLTTKIPKDYERPDTTPLHVEITESGQVLEIKVPKPN